MSLLLLFTSAEREGPGADKVEYYKKPDEEIIMEFIISLIGAEIIE